MRTGPYFVNEDERLAPARRSLSNVGYRARLECSAADWFCLGVPGRALGPPAQGAQVRRAWTVEHATPASRSGTSVMR